MLHQRGTEVSHETVREWRSKFGPLFAAVLDATLINVALTTLARTFDSLPLYSSVGYLGYTLAFGLGFRFGGFRFGANYYVN